MSLVSVVRRNGRSVVRLSECRFPAGSADCIGRNSCNDQPGGASERCGRTRSDRRGGLRGSFHPVRPVERFLRSRTYCNEAKSPEYRSRRGKACNICSRYTGRSDIASSSRRCQTRNGFPLPSTAATDRRSGDCLASVPCKSCRSAR